MRFYSDKVRSYISLQVYCGSECKLSADKTTGFFLGIIIYRNVFSMFLNK